VQSLNRGFVTPQRPIGRADVRERLAPLGCAASIVIDREKLKQTGALTLAFAKDGVVQMRAARAADEDRPWSPGAEARLGPRPAAHGGRERRTKSRYQRGARARRGCRCVAVGIAEVAAGHAEMS
jgi:hypothetical protein